MAKRVVVTGIGMVSSVGNSFSESFENAVNARSGIDLIKKFDTSSSTVKVGGEVKNLKLDQDLEKYLLHKSRAPFINYALSSSFEAFKMSGLSHEDFSKVKSGSIYGIGMTSTTYMDEMTRLLAIKESGNPYENCPSIFTEGLNYENSSMHSLFNYYKSIYGINGLSYVVTTACASGTHAVGEAFLAIKQGLADIMITGGSEDALTASGLKSFEVLTALTNSNERGSSASRPFDISRNGFVMGDGSGTLILEELEHAKKRGAKILCEVVGFGLSTDANHVTAPPEDGSGAARAMEVALRVGKLNKNEIHYINAHGTSTKLNDKAESIAMAKVFNEYAKNISISSTKSVTGHCLGGAGGIEAVLSVGALVNKVVPPTAHLHEQDPDCLGLDFTPLKSKEREINAVMSNSLGFGGVNASIIFKKYK